MPSIAVSSTEDHIRGADRICCGRSLWRRTDSARCQGNVFLVPGMTYTFYRQRRTLIKNRKKTLCVGVSFRSSLSFVFDWRSLSAKSRCRLVSALFSIAFEIERRVLVIVIEVMLHGRRDDLSQTFLYQKPKHQLYGRVQDLHSGHDLCQASIIIGHAGQGGNGLHQLYSLSLIDLGRSGIAFRIIQEIRLYSSLTRSQPFASSYSAIFLRNLERCQ